LRKYGNAVKEKTQICFYKSEKAPIKNHNRQIANIKMMEMLISGGNQLMGKKRSRSKTERLPANREVNFIVFI